MTTTSDNLPVRAVGGLQLSPTEAVDPFRLAGALAKSGYFQDVKDASQALVKILWALEYGIGPVTAMMHVHVIQGKPAPDASLQASMLRRSGVYDYRVKRLDDAGCEIEFYRGGQPCGLSSFTREDASKAKLGGDNWQKYPRNMLFARAMTNGIRWYCPDLFGGAVYTPEELTAGAPVADLDTGEVLTEVEADPDARQAGLRRRVGAAMEQDASYAESVGLSPPAGEQGSGCSACGVEVKNGTREFSLRKYSRVLCVACQKTARIPAADDPEPTQADGAPAMALGY